MAARVAEAQAEPKGDFAELSRLVRQEGLLRRRPGYYTVRIVAVTVLYAASWAAFVWVGARWWTLAVAAVLAFSFGQVALVAHDVGHHQVFRSRRWGAAAGRAAGAAVGMGYGWWQDKHSRHHANPNHEDLDPDVAPDLLVWSPRQAREARGLPRALGRVQAWLFFPLLTLEAFSLRVSSARALADRSLAGRRADGALLAGHIAVYLAAVLIVLPLGMAVVFIAVHQAVFGVYLGVLFAPNHKGMPTLVGPDRPDFLRRQVLTSRNVRGGRITDIVMGGLNHQIEHHLFPRMPSPSLRRARPIVRRYCHEHGIAYCETGLLCSYRQVLAGLHSAGAPLRRARRCQPSL